MENTLENKAKFFAQYWGQRVFKLDGLAKLKSKPFETPMDGDHVELKPISSISHEDAFFVNNLENWNYENMDWIRNTIINCIEYNRGATKTHQYDYLRSKGYALPYMGLSVEQLAEYGWIKLQEA